MSTKQYVETASPQSPADYHCERCFDLPNTPPGAPTPLEDALRELAGHQAMRSQVAIQQVEDRYVAVFDVEVSLPSRAGNDVSATGVRRLETVYLVFPPNFPLKAPTPHLRTDFPSNFAHINPHRRGNLVPPCIFEGDLTELMHRFGIEKIVDQLVDWLKKAAAGQLLDLNQGWEPTRRGSPDTSIEFDADSLAQSLTQDGGVLALPSNMFQVGATRHLALGQPGGGCWQFHFAAGPDDAGLVWNNASVRRMCASGRWPAARLR